MSETYKLAERLATEQGYRRATSVLEFIASWCICAEALGRAPDPLDEYARYWRVHRATAFRDQALFRECLPELDSPEPSWLALRERHPKLFRKPAPVVALRLGGLL